MRNGGKDRSMSRKLYIHHPGIFNSDATAAVVHLRRFACMLRANDDPFGASISAELACTNLGASMSARSV